MSYAVPPYITLIVIIMPSFPPIFRTFRKVTTPDICMLEKSLKDQQVCGKLLWDHRWWQIFPHNSDQILFIQLVEHDFYYDRHFMNPVKLLWPISQSYFLQFVTKLDVSTSQWHGNDHLRRQSDITSSHIRRHVIRMLIIRVTFKSFILR